MITGEKLDAQHDWHDEISNWSDSMVWFFLSILIGLGCTALLVLHAVRVDQENVSRQLERGLDALVAFALQPYLEPLMAELDDAMTGLQTDIHNGVPLNQALLDNYLWDEPMIGLENTSLEYITRTAVEDTYSAALVTAETAGLPVVEQTANGLQQAAPRDEYFPVLLESAPQQKRSVLGLDRSNDPLYHFAMLQARDSGIITVYTQFPVPGIGPQEQIAYYFLPVYAGGIMPATVTERRQNLRGFVSAASYTAASDIAAVMSGDVQGVNSVYFPESADLYSNPEYAVIQQMLRDGRAQDVNYVAQNMPFTAIGVATESMHLALATNVRWWALSLGLLLTAGIATLLLWMSQQSKRIKALVIDRTRDLQTRTNALSEANAALGKSELRYRMLADNATDVISTCDVDGICTYMSPAIKQQRGYSPEDFIGKSIMTRLPPASAQIIREKIESSGLSERIENCTPESIEQSFEYQGLCKDGSLKWLEITLTLMLDADGKASGILGVTRDISERKHAEREREDLEEAYRQAQKMEAIGTLAGGIAHDFNNLLTAIFGYADILRSQVGGNADAEQSIGIIEMAATRASNLTSQLLGFARKGRFQAVQVNLNDTIVEVVSLLKSTVDKNISIVPNLSTRQPFIVGDPGQLSHLFLNLGINARDAMPDGGSLSFKAEIVELGQDFNRMHPEIKPGMYNLVTVSDTGTGIPREDLSRIFDPFYTKKEQGKGTGLGLAMVYGVAKGHDGTVTVESAPGRGSTFRVYLPYTPASGVAAAGPIAEGPIKGRGTILVVDDEAVIRSLAQNMLQQLGYDVLVAEDGVAAVDVYRDGHRHIDLVIVDMMMPNMNGTLCIECLKEINPEVKVILATGYSREALGENINRDEIVGFLQKPYNKQQLSKMLASALQSRAERLSDLVS